MSYGASIAGITQSYKDDPELRARIEQMMADEARRQGANPSMVTPEPEGYIATSLSQLKRIPKELSANIADLVKTYGPSMAQAGVENLPGAGLVQAPKDYGEAARRYREGDYIGGTLNAVQGVINQGAEMVPGLGTSLPTMTWAAGLPAFKAYHGSPTKGIADLKPSERGPLGPGTYYTPNENVAKRYAGEEGELYSRDIEGDDIFHGMRPPGSGSDVNPYQVWRDQRDKLVPAAGDKGPEVQALMEKFQYDDGYRLFHELTRLYGSQEAAQEIMRQAGFKGMSGNIDGPEVVIYGGPR